MNETKQDSGAEAPGIDFEAEKLFDWYAWSDFFDYANAIHKRLEAATKPAGERNPQFFSQRIIALVVAGVEAAPSIPRSIEVRA